MGPREDRLLSRLQIEHHFSIYFCFEGFSEDSLFRTRARALARFACGDRVTLTRGLKKRNSSYLKKELNLKIQKVRLLRIHRLHS